MMRRFSPPPKTEPTTQFCGRCNFEHTDESSKSTFFWNWIIPGKKMRYVITMHCLLCGHVDNFERIPDAAEQAEIISRKRGDQ